MAEAEGFEPPVPFGTLAFKVGDAPTSGDRRSSMARSRAWRGRLRPSPTTSERNHKCNHLPSRLSPRSAACRAAYTDYTATEDPAVSSRRSGVQPATGARRYPSACWRPIAASVGQYDL